MTALPNDPAMEITITPQIQALLDNEDFCYRLFVVREEIQRVETEAVFAVTHLDNRDYIGPTIHGIRAYRDLLEIFASKGAEVFRKRNAKANQY